MGGRAVCLPLLFRLWRPGGRSPSKVELAAQLLGMIAGRLPSRRICLRADGAYAARELARGLPELTELTTRLRRDAALFEPAPPRTGKPGRPRLAAIPYIMPSATTGPPCRAERELILGATMFDMRALPDAAAALADLTEREQTVLRYVAEGLSPKEIAERLDVPEDELYRLVAWVLDELQPAPNGETMTDVHARHGSRPASPGDLEELERRYGPSLAPDNEG